MYTEFYNLKEKPFTLTPSSKYLYLGEIHKEALAFLTYGVIERKGFILLTGEVGTGKTTMVQALLSSLDDNVERVYVSNPQLTTREFMDYLAVSAFKKKVHFKSKADFLVEFENFLKDCLHQQKTFLLIIDEAQRLSFSLLEEIRLLSNMETADEKLINIFLVGQPELNEKLNEPRCRALLQRISVRHHIRPLDLNGTRDYILTRLKIAGAEDGSKIFPKNTIKSIYRYSEGFPRMINILADNALLLGYSREKKKITPDIIDECYNDLRPETESVSTRKPREANREIVLEVSNGKKGLWKWAILILALFGLTFLVWANRSALQDKIHYLKSQILKDRTENSGQGEPGQPKQNFAINNSSHDKAAKADENIETRKDQENPELGEQSYGTGHDLTKEGMAPADDTPEQGGEGTAGAIVEKDKEVENRSQWPVRIVKSGDTLAQLAMEVYGWTDQKILKLIQAHNPEITNVNWISVGQKIVFPPLSAKQGTPTYTVHVASYTPFSGAREEFQRLISEGYEVYIIPVNDPVKGKIYRVTIGSFGDYKSADQYASLLLERGITDYAKPMQLEVK